MRDEKGRFVFSTVDILDRFHSKVSRPADDGLCHEWVGAKRGGGYGQFWDGKKSVGAHRFAYELYTGLAIPDGAVVRHKCDNPSCVNPKHLELGTYKDNSLDLVERGVRPKKPRRVDGMSNLEFLQSAGFKYTAAAKLTNTPLVEDTSEIERLHEAGFKWSAIALITGTPEYLVHAVLS